MAPRTHRLLSLVTEEGSRVKAKQVLGGVFWRNSVEQVLSVLCRPNCEVGFVQELRAARKGPSSRCRRMGWAARTVTSVDNTLP